MLYASGGCDDAVYAYRNSGKSFVLSAKISLGHAPDGCVANAANRTGLGLKVEPNVAGLAISADGKTIEWHLRQARRTLAPQLAEERAREPALESDRRVDRGQGDRHGDDRPDQLTRGLQVMDSTAFALCMDNNLPIVVFNMTDGRNIDKIVSGERVGTLGRT